MESPIVNHENSQPNNNLPVITCSISTLFMVFISVHAIQKWPSTWARAATLLACILPALAVLVNKRQNRFKIKIGPLRSKLL